MDTTRRGGRKTKKSVRIFTNDPANPKLELAFSCRIKKFAIIKPKFKRVKLVGSPGEKIEKKVTIVPGEKGLFKIIGIRAEKGSNIRFDLLESEVGGKQGYVLRVENTKPDTGFYKDAIYLRTDHRLHPEIKIRISGKIYEKVPKGIMDM